MLKGKKKGGKEERREERREKKRNRRQKKQEVKRKKGMKRNKNYLIMTRSANVKKQSRNKSPKFAAKNRQKCILKLATRERDLLEEDRGGRMKERNKDSKDRKK
jgi:hypothetical protein